MPSRLLCILLSLVVSGVAGGCDEPRPLRPDGQPAELRLGYFANLTHAQALLGVHDGTFAAAVAPTALRTRVFNAGPAVIEALFAGEVDLAYIGPGPAINGFVRSRGQEIVVVAGAAANGVVVVARKGSGIRTLDDLAGKRLATPQLGNTQDLSARHFTADQQGRTPPTILPVANAEQLAMMARGQIDAAWSPEPWASRLVLETGAIVVAEEKDLWPNRQFTLSLVITTPRFLREHPQAVERFLAAHVALTDRLQQPGEGDLEQLNAALESLAGKRLPDPVLRSAIGRITFTTEPLRTSLESFAEWTMATGHGMGPADLSRLISLETLHRVQRASDTNAPPEGATR
jgi:NitT/TauT family transport system substrate-binding protein